MKRALILALLASPLAAQDTVRTLPACTGGAAWNLFLSARVTDTTCNDAAEFSGSFTAKCCCMNGTVYACKADGSGGSSNTFQTIDLPAGTDPVADSSTDTLSVTCAAPMTCTGDAGADSWALSTSISTARLSGRTTAGSGVFEEIVVSPPLTLSGLALDIAAIADSDLASNYSGVGSCSSGSAVTATVDNSAPTCSATAAFDDEANIFSQNQTLSGQANLCLQDSSGGDQYCIRSEATAPAGTTTLTLNIDPATCTADSNGGALTVNGSNEIICSVDDGGGGGGLSHPQVMARLSVGGGF